MTGKKHPGVKEVADLSEIEIHFIYFDSKNRKIKKATVFELISEEFNPPHFVFDQSRIDGFRRSKKQPKPKKGELASVALEPVSDRILLNMRALVRVKKK